MAGNGECFFKNMSSIGYSVVRVFTVFIARLYTILKLSWYNWKMQANALIFHGTEGYPEENWFPWLKGELGMMGHNVYVPQFPSPPGVPAKLNEWFDVLKNYEQYINEDTIIIAHSLGGKFALRVLEKLEYPVKAVFFVATPIGIQPIVNNERDNAFTNNDFDWANIKNKAKNFFVFHSDNDPYVSLGNGEELAKKLGVNLTFIPNAGHFNAAAGYLSFPQLFEKVEAILAN